MFVSRPRVFHGKDLRSSDMTTDSRVRGTANIVASNIHTLTAHTSDVTSLAFSRTTLATCSSDKTVRLWGVKDFAELPSSPLLGHTYMIHCCAFSPLGSVLATCSTDGTIRLWDVKTGEIMSKLSHPSKCAIRVCQFSADGTMLVTGGDDDLACLWNVADKKLIRTLRGHDESVTSAAFSPDGNYVVTGSSGGELGGDLMVWDAQFGHGKYLHRVSECHDLGVSCCQFSPAGNNADAAAKVKAFILATGGKDNLVKIWTLKCEMGSVTLWTKLHVCGMLYVTSCAFTSDSTCLATASNDNTVKVWQLTDTSNIMKGLSGFEEGEETSSALAESFDRVAMETWGVEDVCHWIATLGLSDYEEKFRTNAIDGRELLTLTTDDLETSLGIVALGHRNKIIRARAAACQRPIAGRIEEPASTPEEFLCPITQEIMKDPVIASDGYSYDKPAILAWIGRGDHRSPMTNVPLVSNELIPNRTLKMMIQKFLQVT